MKPIHTNFSIKPFEQTEMILKDAVDTLKRLPSQSLRAKLSSWPDVAQRSAEIFSTIPSFTKLAAPSPQAIDQLDYVLSLLLKLSEQERRLVWARASNISWRRLEQFENLSHTTLRKYHKEGIDKLKKNFKEKK